MKYLFNIAFIFIILGGSLGIPVYQHTCLSENISDKAFLFNTTECHDNHEVEVHQDCCSETNDNEGIDDGCCKDEVSSYKVSFFKQFNEQTSLGEMIESPSFCQIISELRWDLKNKEVLTYSDLPPPKLLKRLALIQVWRI